MGEDIRKFEIMETKLYIKEVSHGKKKKIAL